MPIPDVSVVITTRDRPEHLARQLDALRRQTLAPERFEVIVVDDASGPETGRVLGEAAGRRDGPAVRVVRRDTAGGPGPGRNSGWRQARGRLIAFTDDDCVATPAWLEALLAVARDDTFVQGRVAPVPEEAASFGPFSHTVEIDDLSRGFETANIAYPRALLERLDGFDEHFTKSGEDTDLAWRAIEAGFEAVWAPDALVYHAVVDLGIRGSLRRAARWDESVLAYKRHPRLRETLVWRVFWNERHFHAVRALVALALPRRLWWLRWWLAAPYVADLVARRSGPLLAPYVITRDAIEIATLLRGSARYRTLVI